jgi:hypothetical protein
MTMKTDGDKLVITIQNMKAAGKDSKTGKTKLIAGTGGYVAVDHPSGAKLMVNVIVPK